jgi:hypothetical protein
VFSFIENAILNLFVSRRHKGPLVSLTFAALLLTHAAAAPAATNVCTDGTGPGQCREPAGVALDNTSHRVYVADRQNDRIDVFGEDGSFLDSFGTSGSGPGQLSRPWSIAVDNDPASPAFHDVYVVDENLRIQKFTPAGEALLSFGSGQVGSARTPIAVGPGGTVYLGIRQSGETPGRIVKFSLAGAPIGSSVLQADVAAMAVDSKGDAYALAQSNGIQKYEPTEPDAVLLDQFDTGVIGDNTTALAVGSEDHLFAAQLVSNVYVITERDTSGKIIKRFGYGEIQFNLNGLAAGSGALFGSEEYAGVITGNKVIKIAEPPPGPLACCLEATPGNTKAALKGSVNPEGKETTYRIDYLDDTNFKSGGFSNPATKSTAEIPAGSDFDLHKVETQIGCATPEVPAQPSCLHPDTLYHYRLVATSEDGESEEEGTFTTKPPLELTETYATEVGTDSARLHATVNPLGIPATGFFEYATEAAYEADLAQGEGHDGFAGASKAPDVDDGQAPIGLGSGEVPKGAATGIFGLTPGTAYSYRFIAADPFVEVPGPVRTIVTFPVPSPPANVCPNPGFRTGPSALLPDCRAYEMVSPLDKNGGEIKVLTSFQNFRARLEESSADGNRFAYSSITAFGDALSAPWTSEYIATRKEGEGWSTHAISPRRETTSSTRIPTYIKLDLQYKLFSGDLSSSWLIHDTEPPLDECAPKGNLNLYRRDNSTGEYEALTTAEPTDIGKDGYELELQGVSADETRAIIRANGKLTPDAATSGRPQVYEHVQDPEGGCGELRLLSILPNGKASSAAAASLGTFGGALPGESRGSKANHALSADGSRAFWSVVETALYLRDMEAGKTVQIAAGSPQFWNATPDGSKALYSAGGSLYEFDTAKGLAGEPASTPVAAAFEGLVATSEDMSRVYFLSSEAIGGEGEAGERNLYLREGGEKIFIATLPDSTIGAYRYQDGSISQYDFGVGGPVSNGNGVRATVDGSHLAFVSPGELTGYDNTDASGDGLRDLEVYLYDAGTDHLACISCNPSGSRPEGRLFSNNGSPEVRRVSAHMAPGQNQFFAPRTLSADGNRLFFDSFEALLPRDTNGKGDVYEWQRAGSQSECDEMGAELYVPSSGGCLSLISSGQSPSDSEFADASPGGSDVFIRTSSSLVSQDPGQVDVYDARIDGGLPQPVGPPAACEGEACQGPLAAPNDPTPASSAFEGVGNVGEAPAKKRKKAHKAKQRKKSHKQAKHKRRVGAR